MNQLYSRLLITWALILGVISPHVFGLAPTDITFNLPSQIPGATVDEANPGVVIDANGNVIIAWTQSTSPGVYAIYAARFDNATAKWSAPLQISTTLGDISTSPEIAMDGNGNVIVAWFVDFFSVYASRFDASTVSTGNVGWSSASWSGETLLDTASFIINAIGLAMDSTGNGMVVDANFGVGINAILFDFTTKTWQIPFTISEPFLPILPSVAFDGTGNAIVVWNEALSGALLASRYVPGQPWPQGWTAISDIPTISTNIDGGSAPAIATTKATTGSQVGDAMVIWLTPGALSVQAAFYDNTLGFITGGWQTPVTIGQSPLTTFIVPNVKLDNNGNAVALWQQTTGLNASNVFSSNFDFASRTWSSAALISATSQAVESPNLAMDINGNAVATWYRIKPLPDSTVELIIQQTQNNPADGTWFPSHDISFPGSQGFAPNIAINNDYQAAVAWGFPLTSLSVAYGSQIPEFQSCLTKLGTASATSMSGSADKLFLDIISHGIVYTLIHYPNTRCDAWERETVSPATLQALEVSGATDVEGNHVILYTAVPVNTPDANAGAYLYERPTQVTTLVSEPSENAVTPNVILQLNPSANEYDSYTYIDQNAGIGYNTLFNLTTIRNKRVITRAGTKTAVYPAGSFKTRSASAGATIGYTWLITDSTQNNITRVQANYQNLAATDPSLRGRRYLSPDGLDVVRTVTPGIAADGMGKYLFTWAVNDTTSHVQKVQVTSFQISNSSDTWPTFNPVAVDHLVTITSFPAPTPVTSNSVQLYDNNAVLTLKTTKSVLNYYFNQNKAKNPSNAWSLTSGSGTRSRSADLRAGTSFASSGTSFANTATGFQGPGTLGTATTTATTTRTNTTTMTNTTLTQNTNTATTTAKATLTATTATTTKAATTQTTTKTTTKTATTKATTTKTATTLTTATATTTRTTTKTTRKRGIGDKRAPAADDDEDDLYVLLSGPAPLMPLSPINVQAIQLAHRFPVSADIVDIITWQAAAAQSPLPPAVSYEIFLYPNLTTPIATIAADQPLIFSDHGRKPCVTYTYYIYAVDALGTQSVPVIVSVP